MRKNSRHVIFISLFLWSHAFLARGIFFVFLHLCVSIVCVCASLCNVPFVFTTCEHRCVSTCCQPLVANCWPLAAHGCCRPLVAGSNMMKVEKYIFDSCRWGHQDPGNGKLYRKRQCCASNADLSPLCLRCVCCVRHQGGRGYCRLWSPQGDKQSTCGRRIPMGVLCRMGQPDQVGRWRHMTTYCCMGTHMVFSATSTSASGDWQCRPLAAVVGLRLAALLGLHLHVGLCRPLAALLWCHFPERDTFGRLGAAAVDQGTAQSKQYTHGFVRAQCVRVSPWIRSCSMCSSFPIDSFVLNVFELTHESY